MRALFFTVLLLGSAAAGEYKVAFETKDCMGESGFAVVGVDAIHKIEKGDCSDPDNPKQKLKKLLVKSNGSYSVYTLTHEEAKNVMGEVKEYMKTKQQALRNSSTVIIDD